MMIQPIPRHFLTQINRVDRQVKPLENAITTGVMEGRLKPGDRISSPDQLAKNYKLSPLEVLESISQLLARRILRQNSEGDLFIHRDTERMPTLLVA